MDDNRSRPIIVAGAGVAGLTAALAFAAHGYPVQVFERAPRLDEVGAGIQLSPNATRILSRLGLMPALMQHAVRPKSVVLRDARNLAQLAYVPLGDFAEQRWKSPYLVIHRADLQRALAAAAEAHSDISLTIDATVRDIAFSEQGVTASVEIAGQTESAEGALVVGADGVRSSVRGSVGVDGGSDFSGDVAWRTTIESGSPAGELFLRIGQRDSVTTFLHPRFHLVAYPVRAGAAINLVAFTKADGETSESPPERLYDAVRGTAPDLVRLIAEAGPWTQWPIRTVDADRPWTDPRGLALIGDAAHAMTPFAAQGAAMAIEDAETLAALVAMSPGDLSGALAAWEALRRPRILRTMKRGALNRFTWQASGPVALARNLVLRTRSPERLAADLDWLYGWDFQSVS